MKSTKAENETETQNEIATENAQNNEIMAHSTPEASSNQETDNAAMVDDLMINETPPNTTPTTKPTTTTITTITTKVPIPLTLVNNTQASSAHFVLPINTTTTTITTTTTTTTATMPQTGGGLSCSLLAEAGSNSLKKKRNKSATKRNAIDTRRCNVVDGTPAEGEAMGTGSAGGVKVNANTSIKTSLSMTSLPPDEKQESRDVIKAKLWVERPYNSLKKTAEKHHQHRLSWGSGQSSSSLHSSATLGPDDFWAAIQTNYNYIMDTNLLDTCKEARCEIEGAASVLENPIECFKMLDDTQRSEGSCGDPKELRKWLREMESKLETAPSVSEATMFSIAELQLHLTEHSVLYHEIVSHARVVSACIRAASEKEQQQQQQKLLQQQQTLNDNAEQTNSSLSSTEEAIATKSNISSNSSSNNYTNNSCTSISSISSNSSSSGIGTVEAKLQPIATTSAAAAAAATAATAASAKIEGNLERLQNRYHLVYLKAFEVQLWLDGLLRKKSSSTNFANNSNDNDNDTEDEDDEDVDCDNSSAGATEDDLNDVASDLESDITHNSSSSSDLPRRSADNERALAAASRETEQTKADCEDGDDEEEDEDEVDGLNSRSQDWPNLGYSAVLVTYDTNSVGNTCRATLTDFEADSESSDSEIIQNSRRQRKFHLSYAQQQQKVATATNLGTTSSLVTNHTRTQLSINNHNALATIALDSPTNNAVAGALNSNMESKMLYQQCSVVAASAPLTSKLNIHEQRATFYHTNGTNSNIKAAAAAACNAGNPTNLTASTATQTQQKLQTFNGSCNNKNAAPVTPTKQKSIAVISPNCHGNNTNNNNNNKSPSLLRKRQQQQRHNDISKFNRSNRKSKNCAIFYFKHLDTDDNETTSYGGGGGGSGGLSSSASDLLKSADASSDDEDDDEEGWLYSSAAAAGTATNIDCLNSTVIVVDGIQSATVSSSTATPASTAAAICSDDSDKENKEALAAAAAAGADTNQRVINSASLNSTQIAIAEIQLASSPTKAAAATAAAAATFVAHTNVTEAGGCGNSSSSLSNCDSSCSSNELLTETTTSATTTKTQNTQMRCQRNANEMELQINGNNCCSNLHNNNNNNNNGNNSNSHKICNEHIKLKNVQQQHLLHTTDADANGNPQKNKLCFYTRADICNISVKSNETQPIQTADKRLPPRSPAKSGKSHKSNGHHQHHHHQSASSPTKAKVSHESIQQLVREAEHLVRDEALKTPISQRHALVKHSSSTVKKREAIMPGPIQQRVQEWLEHQPTTQLQLHKSHEQQNASNVNSSSTGTTRTDDCEASGEASETDSIPQPGSDTSEGFTDSIATCMQTSTNSYGNSTERIGGSAEPIIGPVGCGSSNQSLNIKTISRRPQTRRKSERPWSVSCLSQLTTDPLQVSADVSIATVVQAGLATHSISESALDSLSPGRPRASSSSAVTRSAPVKHHDSKGSLKRRRTRKKKHSNSHSAGKKTDSGSEETGELPKLTQTLLMKSCESMTAQQIQEITSALLTLQKCAASSSEQLANGGQQLKTQKQLSTQSPPIVSDEEGQLQKPNFRVGSYTTAYMTSEARLGPLAALATYMNDEEQQGAYTTGTDDHHSSFSETAWDNYQEKYNSENYSEGFDSDAARRLMEFGDDYRQFIDSQSDCCSSLSAANNVDSLSPPRMDSLQQNETKLITQDNIVSSVDHARRRRALELEYERRRKTLEVRRKSCQDSSDNNQNPRSPTMSLSSSANALTPKNTDKFHFQHKAEATSRKLEFGMSHSAQSLRRTSESDTSTRRRKADERRRSSRNLEKCIKVKPATSSSSGDDSDDEKEMRNLLHQSRNRLEDTRALKIRCHLLRPEDYTEIINTCRDNIRCLEAVLHGPPGSVLSAPCVSQTKDLLAAWEDLLGWSENAAAARKMQQEMIVLKHALKRLGNKSSFELLDTEPSIQIAIEALKNEKLQLQTYRTSMLRLNASVHSWLTRQERKLQSALVEKQLKEAAARVTESLVDQQQATLFEEREEAESEQTQNPAITITEHQEMDTVASVSSVSTSTNATVDTNASEKMWDLNTLMSAESEFHKHLKDEVSDMYSAWDEADARINTQLEVLTTSLIAWRQLECGLFEFQQALGQDRGTLAGLEGALDKGQATSVELAQNVKLVAKLLSEKVNVSQEQLTAVQEHLDPNHILHIAKFTASNGSLSDSGISDGGTTSDGGLSERERRLGVLRRLAKQLESALAPGSEAMKSIAARMESAEAELKTLQNTCRDLIVRTAATHQNKLQQQMEAAQQKSNKTEFKFGGNGYLKVNGHAGIQQPDQQQQQNSPTKRKNKRKQNKQSTDSSADATDATSVADNKNGFHISATAPDDDDDDPADDPLVINEFDFSDDDDESGKLPKRGWVWRIAKAAIPLQLALITFLCAAFLMQPNCCDNLNNLSMSFTPQLRYIRGPPPV